VFDAHPIYWVAIPWKTWNTQGIFWTWKTRGILREFCATSVRNCNKQSTFSSSFKYLCKTAVDWVNRIIGNRDEVRVRWWPVILLELLWNDPWWRSLLHLLFVTITSGKVSLWLWRSLETQFFSPTLWPPCIYCHIIISSSIIIVVNDIKLQKSLFSLLQNSCVTFTHCQKNHTVCVVAI